MNCKFRFNNYHTTNTSPSQIRRERSIVYPSSAVSQPFTLWFGHFIILESSRTFQCALVPSHDWPFALCHGSGRAERCGKMVYKAMILRSCSFTTLQTQSQELHRRQVQLERGAIQQNNSRSKKEKNKSFNKKETTQKTSAA